ncbi:hypothetical protein [Chryseobacterium sp.]|uniref:hypothetical protein n=1 Tax=Chryseobacterium sp. TaxID=1871047 RepID=UPI0012A86E73|nr:hypothetical protein [Chryseobacterium sp.]QFG52907.1 hypothetical protein F7R58_04880 [Chryseobacterium sp.]
MATKFLKVFFAALILSMLQSCPGIEEECNDFSVPVPDLITITPLKPTYNQGEEIIYKLTIPAQNDYFGSSINLYEKTGDTNSWYTASSTYLFDGNTVVYLKGSKRNGAENWHNVAYNSSNGNYELEIKVKLNKIGNYSMFAEDMIDFQGSPKCNRYGIKTNILGMNSDRRIEFTVQ